MPLRDHFRPPVDNIASWEGFHGGWPMVTVQNMRNQLPAEYVAEPRIHRGSTMEIDVSADIQDDPTTRIADDEGDGGVATAVWAPPEPTLNVEASLADYDAYEVLVYDMRKERTLVAAIEIISPANKDRPDSRNVFSVKCAALLQKGVAVSIVDLVTVRHFNLYAGLLESIDQQDPVMTAEELHLYAASCRWVKFKKRKKKILQAWSHELIVGQPLPTLPLWLSDDLVLPLDLEKSYEKACYDLWIT